MGEIEKMCHFCNTTPLKPYKILKHLLFPDVDLSLTCIYILIRPTFGSFFLPKNYSKLGTRRPFRVPRYNLPVKIQKPKGKETLIFAVPVCTIYFFYTKKIFQRKLSASESNVQNDVF